MTAVTGLAVLSAGGVASVLGAGFLYPIKKVKPPALFICLDSELPYDDPLEITDQQGRKVLLMRQKDGTPMAMSTVCTHLGCAVFYRKEKGIFECPCHQGVFDAMGNPTAGPPPRPLDRYEVEVRGGKIFVQFT